MISINWIAKKPTLYNNFLFNAVSGDSAFDLTVHFIEKWDSNHPWQEEIKQDFPSRVFEKRSGLDWNLLQLALRETQTFFILGGFWFNPTVIALTYLLTVLKRPFALWTDTPNVKKQRQLFKRLGRNILLKHYFRNAHRVMGTGEVALRALEQTGCPYGKLVNFPFFVDLERFKPPIDRKVKEPVVLVSSGRLDNSHKGYDLAIRALSVLKQRSGCEFTYRIAGTGKDEQQLRTLVEQGGIAKNVEFVGWVEDSQLRDFYRSGHIFLHPSHFDPFPVSVLEAMASGLAVVGSDQAGSIVERIISGKNGLVHRSNDVEDLATKLSYLIGSPDEVLRLGSAARRTAEEWPVERALKILKQDIISIQN